MIGIPLTTLAYVLANIGYFAVMSKEEILLSHAVAVVCLVTYEPVREKTNNLHGRKQRRRSASR